MKNDKIKLNDLKVKSFVTDMAETNSNTVKGGMPTPSDICSVILCRITFHPNCFQTNNSIQLNICK